MSRQFNDSASNYLNTGTPTHDNSTPLTMACWFNSDDSGVDGAFMNVCDRSGYTGFALGPAADNTISASTITGSGDTGIGVSAGTLSANTWHHACGVFGSGTEDRTSYLDGVPGVKNTENQSVGVDIDDFVVGAFAILGSIFVPMDGEIAEAAIWNAALTTEEVESLAAGYSPLFIRPQNLKAYWPLIGGLNNMVGDDELIVNGSVPAAAHVSIITPAPVMYGAPPAPVGGVVVPIFWHHLNKNIGR